MPLVRAEGLRQRAPGRAEKALVIIIRIHCQLGEPVLAREEAKATARSMATLGLQTALDLRLLVGGPETEEQIGELRLAGVGL